LQGNFVIISTHAPFLYSLGFVMMECLREREESLNPMALSRQIGKSILSQPLVIGILFGYAVNLSGLGLPDAFWSGIDLIARAGIPAALFGLGGVLFRYKPEGDRATIAMICAIGLILHPSLTWALGSLVFHLDTAALRSAVVTAAMAPGVNAYLFANIYGVGKRVTASAVLFSTALSIGTTWIWLHILP
jgi:predicted permease